MTAARVELGLERQDVADALRSTTAKVAYCENQDRPFRRRDLVEVVFPLYKIPEDEWPTLLAARDRSAQKGWWARYDADVVPDWFGQYLGLEMGASLLRGLSMQLVPGLLQTPAYARAIMTETSGLDAEDAAGRAEVRLKRQEVLAREPDPLNVHYILDEAVLRRQIGGADVMGEQLEHLLNLGDWLNVTLQVVPFERGYYFDGKGEPVLLSFPWPDDPGVVYVEGRARGEILEELDDVTEYGSAFEHSRHVALPPVESRVMIENIARDYQ